MYELYKLFFFVQTLNGQLEDCEEELDEFDKKCMGIESSTAPLVHIKGNNMIKYLNHLLQANNMTWVFTVNSTSIIN